MNYVVAAEAAIKPYRRAAKWPNKVETENSLCSVKSQSRATDKHLQFCYRECGKAGLKQRLSQDFWAANFALLKRQMLNKN